MPSKLPIIKANTTQENIEKMRYIANKNKRSIAKELELLIENHIKEYEEEHGEIETLRIISADTNTSNSEKLKKAFKLGMKTEEKMHNKKETKD